MLIVLLLVKSLMPTESILFNNGCGFPGTNTRLLFTFFPIRMYVFHLTTLNLKYHNNYQCGRENGVQVGDGKQGISN